ncbi:MAG TPA: fused MFS/spermidine synthase, partial [Bryobacteraceae bacterium]
ALLLGYLYSHATTRYLRPKTQAILHSILLILSLGVLIVMLQLPGSSGWKPVDEKTPLLRILVLLGATVGLPYLMLSTTGPLIQAWYVRATGGAIPYRLFALSNFGSFLALLSFPFVVEPLLSSREQVYVWGAGFGIFAFLTMYTGWRTLQSTGNIESEAEHDHTAQESAPFVRIPFRAQLLWIALAATASIMLLAITSQLTQNVAPIPFLWVLPLSIYLLTFILSFESNRYYKREIFLPLLAIALAFAAALLMEDNRSGFWPIYAWAAILFVCCMVCHGELASQKPHPKQLTLFFLMVSIGGAIGGSFVAILAPLAFESYWELPISLTLCGGLAAWVFWSKEVRTTAFLPNRWRIAMLIALGISFSGLLLFYRRESEEIWKRQLHLAVPLAMIFTALVAWAVIQDSGAGPAAIKMDWIAVGFGLVCVALLTRDVGMRYGYFLPQEIIGADTEDLGFGFLATLASMAAIAGLLSVTGPASSLSSKRLGILFAVLAVALGGHLLKYQLAAMSHLEDTDSYRLVIRNFYGVLKIRDQSGSDTTPPERVLVHGTINHGAQLLDDRQRRVVTTYYNPKSGFGRMMQIEQRKGPLKVGITGLGAGVTAGFCRSGDTFRFYELNPLVLSIARTWFTFLADCPADKEVYLGDGRLNLERQASQQFDVLAMDAFSSDSVPVHLLTTEVFGLYKRHLKSDGVLAINVSNRYLNLTPVVSGNADANGMSCVLVSDDGNDEEYFTPTSWMLCSSNAQVFEDPLFKGDETKHPKPNPKIRLWTDDYSNLFQILKKRGVDE